MNAVERRPPPRPCQSAGPGSLRRGSRSQGGLFALEDIAIMRFV